MVLHTQTIKGATHVMITVCTTFKVPLGSQYATWQDDGYKCAFCPFILFVLCLLFLAKFSQYILNSHQLLVGYTSERGCFATDAILI